MEKNMKEHEKERWIWQSRRHRRENGGEHNG
jgi:hypothetical protein